MEFSDGYYEGETLCLSCLSRNIEYRMRVADAIDHLLWGGLFTHGLVDEALQKTTDVLRFLRTLKDATYEAHEDADPTLAEKLWEAVDDMERTGGGFAKLRELASNKH